MFKGKFCGFLKKKQKIFLVCSCLYNFQKQNMLQSESLVSCVLAMHLDGNKQFSEGVMRERLPMNEAYGFVILYNIKTL